MSQQDFAESHLLPCSDCRVPNGANAVRCWSCGATLPAARESGRRSLPAPEAAPPESRTPATAGPGRFCRLGIGAVAAAALAVGALAWTPGPSSSSSTSAAGIEDRDPALPERTMPVDVRPENHRSLALPTAPAPIAPSAAVSTGPEPLTPTAAESTAPEPLTPTVPASTAPGGEDPLASEREQAARALGLAAPLPSTDAAARARECSNGALGPCRAESRAAAPR